MEHLNQLKALRDEAQARIEAAKRAIDDGVDGQMVASLDSLIQELEKTLSPLSVNATSSSTLVAGAVNLPQTIEFELPVEAEGEMTVPLSPPAAVHEPAVPAAAPEPVEEPPQVEDANQEMEGCDAVEVVEPIAAEQVPDETIEAGVAEAEAPADAEPVEEEPIEISISESVHAVDQDTEVAQVGLSDPQPEALPVDEPISSVEVELPLDEDLSVNTLAEEVEPLPLPEPLVQAEEAAAAVEEVATAEPEPEPAEAPATVEAAPSVLEPESEPIILKKPPIVELEDEPEVEARPEAADYTPSVEHQSLLQKLQQQLDDTAAEEAPLEEAS